jgi:iron complex outermembrane receptor protein
MEGYLKYFISYDVADSFKLSTTHELDALHLQGRRGRLSYSQRFKQFGQNPSGYLVNSDGKAQAPLPPLIGTTDLGFIGNLHPIAYDPNAALNSGLYTFLPNPNPGSWEGDNYNVWEDVTRPFVKFDLKGNLFGLPFDGNIGVTGDFASQNSTGLSGNGGTYRGSRLRRRQLRGRPAQPEPDLQGDPHDLIRFFIGRQEMRPTMYQMRDSRDYSYNASNALSTSTARGAPRAETPNSSPWLANSVDLDSSTTSRTAAATSRWPSSRSSS